MKQTAVYFDLIVIKRFNFHSAYWHHFCNLSSGHQQPEAENAMKMIMAIIKPFKLNDVRDALNEEGIQGLTVLEVRGAGRQKGHTELYRGEEYSTDFLPKTQLTIVVPDDSLDRIIEAICRSAYTGSIGDGKIFVSDITQAVRIRTGEQNDEAI